MFGKNPIRSITLDPNKLAVESMFYTIQGEGPYAGMPALFIRLAGCNLACHFCDTQFETQAENARGVFDVMQDLTSKFTADQRRFVVVTGGEPMRQNWSRLAAGLYGTGTQLIQVETAGTLWQPDFDRMSTHPGMQWVCSPKTPKVNPRIIDVCHHWKYIVRAGELADDDGLPCFGTQVGNRGSVQRLFRPDRAARGYRDTIWLSPCDDHDDDLPGSYPTPPNVAAARDSCLKHGYRLTLQLHKLVGVE